MDPLEKLILWLIRLKGSVTPLYAERFLQSQNIPVTGFGEIWVAIVHLREEGLIGPRQLPFQIPLSNQYAHFIFTESGRAASRKLPDDPRPIFEEIQARMIKNPPFGLSSG